MPGPVSRTLIKTSFFSRHARNSTPPRSVNLSGVAQQVEHNLPHADSITEDEPANRRQAQHADTGPSTQKEAYAVRRCFDDIRNDTRSFIKAMRPCLDLG